MTKIKKAILPVAGFGTRFLPATKAQPKEMLPVVDKPAIQYLVEEAAAAGIEEIVFVTGRGKRAIEDHFDYSYELDHTLVEKNKHDLVKKVREVEDLAKFSYVRQPVPLGDGHAVLCARHIVGDEPVLVMFGDSLYDSEVPAAKQLIDVYEKYNDVVVGLSEVKPDEVERFGVIDGIDIGNGIYEIKKFVEKPKKEEAPSNLVAVGKYIITPEIFELLSTMKGGKSGEIRLADAFDLMLQKNRPIYGKKLDGEWLDTGEKLTFITTTIKLGIKHPEIGEKLKRFIKELDIK
ncbi:MAG TPA: UTP--glucose-1-phosphate uridylyltransferase GalU [Candidatus Moranbacteria bacterium]|nr:UTP--glucose-1-phosphate uridylyltransferase GalU [Candidatus Moranbacteria bacterium]